MRVIAFGIPEQKIRLLNTEDFSFVKDGFSVTGTWQAEIRKIVDGMYFLNHWTTGESTDAWTIYQTNVKLEEVAKSESFLGWGADILEDGNYLYIANEQIGGAADYAIQKIRKSDLESVAYIQLGVPPSSKGSQVAKWGLASEDSTYLYAITYGNLIHRIRKSDMQEIDYAEVYGSGVNPGVCADSNYLYTSTDKKVKKINKSTMAVITESSEFHTDSFLAMALDDDYVYFSLPSIAGTPPIDGVIHKLAKSNLGIVESSGVISGINYMIIDEDYLYCCGSGIYYPEANFPYPTLIKIRKSDMVIIDAYYGGDEIPSLYCFDIEEAGLENIKAERRTELAKIRLYGEITVIEA